MMKRRVVCVRVRAFWGATVVAVLAAVLGAAALVVGAQEGAPYSDVPSGTYYAGPVSTLAAAGVFVGTECDEGFCPGAEIDRATMAVWTVRVLDGVDPPTGCVNPFRRRGRGASSRSVH